MRRRLVLALLSLCAFLAGCPRPDPADGGTQAPVDAAPGTPPPVVTWTRDAGATSLSAESDAGLAVTDDASAAALDEILAAAPRERPGPTGADGGTRVGTTTQLPSAQPPAPGASASAPPARSARVDVGAPTAEPAMASPAIEREGRAQLYWNLVQRCRGEAGEILPPDAITLSFTIDAAGYIQPSTIVATPNDPRHDKAAQCMIRELGAASFRAPPSARGIATRVVATVPSVD